MNFGNIYLSTNKSVQLKATDIKLNFIGKHKTFPDNFLIHVMTKEKTFRFVIDIEKKKSVHFVNTGKFLGYECYNIPGLTQFSTSGNAIIEFSYDFEGK